MSKRTKSHAARRPAGTESRSVEALTVFWSLMVMTVLVCLVLATATGLYFRWADSQATTIGLLSGILWFAGGIIGLGTLVITPVVVRARRKPPPRSIIVAAVVIGAAPLIMILLQMTYPR